MTVIWVVLALLAVGGVMAFSLWRRRGQGTGAGPRLAPGGGAVLRMLPPNWY
jgi:hypothetical protein